jgi:hypothetical protein
MSSLVFIEDDDLMCSLINGVYIPRHAGVGTVREQQANRGGPRGARAG